MKVFRSIQSIFCAALFAVMLIQAAFAGDDWAAISPAELSLKEAKIEKDADAEALMWEVYVAGEENGPTLQTVLRHYIRIKIFNERGREKYSKIDIPFVKMSGSNPFNVKIKDIAARTTKADGSTVELKSEDIFEREIVKGEGVKIKAKSFAVPGIEPGAIIEYRWKEIRDRVSFYQRLDFAQEIPVHQIKYHIKPVPTSMYGMRAQAFNVKISPWQKGKDNFYTTSAENVPSYKEEPIAPAEYIVRPWMLLYYTEDKKLEPQKFWKEYAKETYETWKPYMKVNDEVRQATNEAVSDAAMPEQKVERIFRYVRAKIKNIYDDASGFTADDRAKMKENKTPADTLKRGQGDADDINMLFAAMTAAAGLDTRVARSPMRTNVFSPDFTDSYFMRTYNIAVKIGDDWKFFDPSSRYVQYGMVMWEEEGQPALIADSKEPVWAKTPVSTPQQSLEKRSGKFKLLEDGTLEGDVRLEFTGHIAEYHKEYNDDDNQQEREETLKNLVKSNVLGSAEVSNITIENVSDPEKPFIYTFKVRVPGYATRTGKRLFLQPNFFERSTKPVFETTTRRYDIEFRYPYSEQDDIIIELPSGYSLESPDAPAPVKDAQNIGLDDIKISVTKDGRTLIYKRNFYFGNGGFLHFPQSSYPALKQLFEAYHQANIHALTLKQDVAGASKN